MGGVGQVLRAAPGLAAAAPTLEPLTDARHIEAQLPKRRSARAVGAEQRQHDVLGPDGVVLESHRLGPRLVERPLGAGAQRVRIHAGRRTFLAQSGFASSTSMMGMPSSTG